MRKWELDLGNNRKALSGYYFERKALITYKHIWLLQRVERGEFNNQIFRFSLKLAVQDYKLIISEKILKY